MLLNDLSLERTAGPVLIDSFMCLTLAPQPFVFPRAKTVSRGQSYNHLLIHFQHWFLSGKAVTSCMHIDTYYHVHTNSGVAQILDYIVSHQGQKSELTTIDPNLLISFSVCSQALLMFTSERERTGSSLPRPRKVVLTLRSDEENRQLPAEGLGRVGAVSQKGHWGCTWFQLELAQLGDQIWTFWDDWTT